MSKKEDRKVFILNFLTNPNNFPDQLEIDVCVALISFIKESIIDLLAYEEIGRLRIIQNDLFVVNPTYSELMDDFLWLLRIFCIFENDENLCKVVTKDKDKLMEILESVEKLMLNSVTHETLEMVKSIVTAVEEKSSNGGFLSPTDIIHLKRLVNVQNLEKNKEKKE